MGKKLSRASRICGTTTKDPIFISEKGGKKEGSYQGVNNEIRWTIFSAAKHGEALYSQQKQDHELTVAQIMSSLMQNWCLGNTTSPFRYDLSQIPHDYTAEVTNRFKGLNLIDRVPEELWVEVYNIVQEVVTKTMPKKKRKGKIYPFEYKVPKNGKER